MHMRADGLYQWLWELGEVAVSDRCLENQGEYRKTSIDNFINDRIIYVWLDASADQ